LIPTPIILVATLKIALEIDALPENELRRAETITGH
jgi:hypothetical protein